MISVRRTNLRGWNDSTVKKFGNDGHYDEIKSWCERSFPSDIWSSCVDYETGQKKFYFDDEKYATLFLLKWGNDVVRIE